MVGPESTGKSTLCEQLAEHYHTLWCREFARQYLSTLNRKYTYEDLLIIAREQIALEESLTQKLLQSKQSATATPPLLFIDTDLYVMKVWSEFVFGKCDPWILEQIAVRTYDLYLLCAVDLPWKQDQLREYPDPDVRKALFTFYKEELINQQVPWKIIHGNERERLAVAQKHVEEFLKHHSALSLQ